MNAMKRSEAVKSFGSDDDGSPRFIICSLHAAGTGINLTRANCVFMMDCWWNQAVENQASKLPTIERTHRDVFHSDPIIV
jgi:DNA repair protein RAD5